MLVCAQLTESLVPVLTLKPVMLSIGGRFRAHYSMTVTQSAVVSVCGASEVTGRERSEGRNRRWKKNNNYWNKKMKKTNSMIE